MKIWCDKCEGTGGSKYSRWWVNCENCNGKGYVEDNEIDEKIKLADAIEYAFNANINLYEFEYDYDYDDNSIEYYNLIASSNKKLINWYEDQIKNSIECGA